MKFIQSCLIVGVLVFCNSSSKVQALPLKEFYMNNLNIKQFQDIPLLVISKVKKHNCIIPQTYISNEPHNVIQGEFARLGQKDWAVLCFNGVTTKILIVWGGDIQCENFLAAGSGHYLQSIDEIGTVGYSRMIFMANKEKNLSYSEYYGDDRESIVEHDAIGDAFTEKASTIHYCRNGRWLSFGGAD